MAVCIVRNAAPEKHQVPLGPDFFALSQFPPICVIASGSKLSRHEGRHAMKYHIRETAAAALLAAVFLSAPAAADSGRYVMEKTENGYVRMDTATGEMSICAEKNGQIICKLAADERAAFQDALDRLEERVARLEAHISSDGVVQRVLPSDEEIDRGLDNMEKFFRRFFGIVEEFDQDMKQDDKT
jgi:hypothetical protein